MLFYYLLGNMKAKVWDILELSTGTFIKHYCYSRIAKVSLLL